MDGCGSVVGGESMSRKREKLILANGPTPEITAQTNEKPILYLSHTVVHSKELEEEFLRCSGVRYRCFSFVYLVPEAIYFSKRALESYDYNVEKGSHIMMDSGAFSFHMFTTKNKVVQNLDQMRERTVQQYVDWCRGRQKRWDFHVTFDYIHDQPTIRKMQLRLELAGLHPMPVYHGDRPMDWLKSWLDGGYKRIGISNLPWRKLDYKKTRRYLDEVFRTCEPYSVKLHGFAMTSLALTFAYPWHSVDSSSWSRTASYGAIYGVDPQRGTLANIHVSLTGGLKSTTTSATSLSPEALKSVRYQVEEGGWDFDLLRRSLAYRFIYNGWLFSHLNQFRKYVKDTHVRWGKLL